MKSKRRHHTSSEDSEESDDSAKSSSSSDSDSDDSSFLDSRYKKKRKHADSSESDSDSDGQKRSKKRKHKKKKKKHGKKKRRANSEDVSASGELLSSVSEGEISPKKKRKQSKHKHKRARTSSGSDVEEVHVERRLHSVVKERRVSTGQGNHPAHTYYQKEYPHSAPRDDYDREREVQRFYRGSSKEGRPNYQDQIYDRERNDRYATYQQGKFDRNREKYGHSSQYNDMGEDIIRRPPEYVEYKRPQRYEDQRPHEEYRRRPRDDNLYPREDNRGFNRYNQFEERGPKHRDFDEGRDYRERRPPEPERFREREQQLAEKREKYREERFSPERREGPPRRDVRERPGRSDKPPLLDRFHDRSRSMDRYRSRKPPPGREERGEAVRETRVESGRPHADDRRPRPERSDNKPDKSSRPPIKSEPKPRERKTRFGEADDKEYTWGKEDVKNEGGNPSGEKEKPNFGLSGKLTADQNTVNGVVIKYTEPDDAKQPKRRWRFYPFKGDKALPILYIHRQSAFLIGRDKKVVDIALEHPSISKQHAALQYRATPFTRDDGSQGRRVRPYVIDLESANGTFVNNKKIEPRRYVELLERDVVKFGFSQREYVLLHENSKDDDQDDDHLDPPSTSTGVSTTDQIKQEKRAKQEVAEDGE